MTPCFCLIALHLLISFTKSANIILSDVIINTTSDRFVSYTLDACQLVNDPNPLNLSNTQFRYLTSKLSGYLRVGGTCGDLIYYKVGDENPCNLPINSSYPYWCLSMDKFDELIDFALSTDSKLVFGLSFGYPLYPLANTTWNSSNTRQFLQYLHDIKHYNNTHIYGFELGNELDRDPYKYVEQQSDGFYQLKAILDEIWGTDNNNFKLFGPDPHSYILTEGSQFNYIPDFMERTCPILDGVNYHCYIGQNASAILTPNGLNEQYRQSVRVSNIFNLDMINKQSAHCRHLRHHIWAGEIAEHNSGGASPSVLNTYYDGFWYLDALGTLSKLGHSVFARQCLPYSTYSLLGNDPDYEPHCDYYTAYLFKTLMSNKVVKVESDDENLRIYALCTKNGGKNNGVTMAYINLNRNHTVIQYDSFLLNKEDIYVWMLTPGNMTKGLSSDTMALNGHVLRMNNGKLPTLNGKQWIETENVINVPPLSYGYILFNSTMLSVCGAQ